MNEIGERGKIIKLLLIQRDSQYRELAECQKRIRDTERELYQLDPSWYNKLDQTWDYDV